MLCALGGVNGCYICLSSRIILVISLNSHGPTVGMGSFSGELGPGLAQTGEQWGRGGLWLLFGGSGWLISSKDCACFGTSSNGTPQLLGKKRTHIGQGSALSGVDTPLQRLVEPQIKQPESFQTAGEPGPVPLLANPHGWLFAQRCTGTGMFWHCWLVLVLGTDKGFLLRIWRLLARITHWFLSLQEFSFQIQHWAGTQPGNAYGPSLNVGLTRS